MCIRDSSNPTRNRCNAYARQVFRIADGCTLYLYGNAEPSKWSTPSWEARDCLLYTSQLVFSSGKGSGSKRVSFPPGEFRGKGVAGIACGGKLITPAKSSFLVSPEIGEPVIVHYPRVEPGNSLFWIALELTHVEIAELPQRYLIAHDYHLSFTAPYGNEILCNVPVGRRSRQLFTLR